MSFNAKLATALVWKTAIGFNYITEVFMGFIFYRKIYDKIAL